VAKQSITTIKRTLNYFNITAFPGGDKGLFGEKLKTLCESLDALERETDYRGRGVRFDIESVSDNGIIKGTFQQLRENAPSIRKAGQENSKPILLEDDEGVNEKTHFMYDPVTSRICVENNYHGPKIGLMVNVINSMYKTHVDNKERRNSFEFIQTKKAIKKIKELYNVRSVVARYTDPYSVDISPDSKEAPDVFKEFSAPQHSRLEIKLTSTVKGGVVMKTVEFFNKFLKEEKQLQLYEKLQVNVEDDETGKPRVFDLVKDQLHEEIIAPLTQGTREVNSTAIFEIMEEKFEKSLKTIKA
jgi:hypothetical protein